MTFSYDDYLKRTTLILDERILDERRLTELKRLAAERGQTLSTVVDEFLADGIRRASAPKRRTVALPVFDMGEPHVNVADRHQLESVLEQE